MVNVVDERNEMTLTEVIWRICQKLGNKTFRISDVVRVQNQIGLRPTTNTVVAGILARLHVQGKVQRVGIGKYKISLDMVEEPEEENTVKEILDRRSHYKVVIFKVLVPICVDAVFVDETNHIALNPPAKIWVKKVDERPAVQGIDYEEVKTLEVKGEPKWKD